MVGNMSTFKSVNWIGKLWLPYALLKTKQQQQQKRNTFQKLKTKKNSVHDIMALCVHCFALSLWARARGMPESWVLPCSIVRMKCEESIGTFILFDSFMK